MNDTGEACWVLGHRWVDGLAGCASFAVGTASWIGVVALWRWIDRLPANRPGWQLTDWLLLVMLGLALVGFALAFGGARLILAVLLNGPVME